MFFKMSDERIKELYDALKSGMPYVVREEALELIAEIERLKRELNQ